MAAEVSVSDADNNNKTKTLYRNRGMWILASRSRYGPAPDTRHLADPSLINPPFKADNDMQGRQESSGYLSIPPSFVIRQADLAGEAEPNPASPADRLQLFVT